MNIDRLIEKGMKLRCAVDTLKRELDSVNRDIVALAEFPEGKNTAWVLGSCGKARVVNRVYDKWDQARLDEIRGIMGEDAFGVLFRRVWEPVSRREVQGFLSHGPAEYAELLRGALSTKVTPAVSFVTRDETVDDAPAKSSGPFGWPEGSAPAEALDALLDRFGAIAFSVEPDACAASDSGDKPAVPGVQELRTKGGHADEQNESGNNDRSAEPAAFADHPSGSGSGRCREHRRCSAGSADPRSGESTFTGFALPNFLAQAFGTARA